MHHRRPTIKDIATHAGVSFKSVSRVINGEASVGADIRERVEASIEALGYHPNLGARSLRSGLSFSLALLATSRENVNLMGLDRRMASYVTDVMVGLLQACHPADYHLVIDTIASLDADAGRPALTRFLDVTKPDGVLLIPPLCDLDWVLETIEQRGIGLGRLNPGHDTDRGTSLWIDNEAAGETVGSAILDHGHRRIAYIAGPETQYAQKGRLRGFQRRLAQAPETVLTVVAGDFTYDTGRLQGGFLLDQNDRPTAIFAANDEMAAGVLAAALERGIRIPEELSIVGFGSLVISQQTAPQIATVSQPTTEMARQIGAHLIAANRNRSSTPAPEGPVEFRFIPRKSLGAAPAK